MKLLALTHIDALGLTAAHLGIGQQILNLIEDLGKDQDIVVSLDDPENPDDTEFCVYFPGSDLFLHYTYDGILIEQIGEDEDELVKVFGLERTNEATHWLLTQVN